MKTNLLRRHLTCGALALSGLLLTLGAAQAQDIQDIQDRNLKLRSAWPRTTHSARAHKSLPTWSQKKAAAR